MYTINRFQSSYATKQTAALDNERLIKLAPSIFTDVKHESRAERYQVIPTIQVVESLRNEGFYPVFAAETRARDFSRFGYTKHLIRFRKEGDGFNNVGDVLPEIVMLNSHDGTSSYQLSAGLFRLACSNGMVVSDGEIDQVRVRHSGNVIDNVIEGTYRILNETPLAIEHMQVMKGLNLSDGEKRVLATAAKELRWDSEKQRLNESDLIRPRRQADTGSDLWSTFNVIQEKVIRGGIQVTNLENNNTQRAKEIKSVSESVKLNKALWTLAEEFAKLKAA